MAETNTQLPSPGQEYKLLDTFAGRWNTQGVMKTDEGEDIKIKGTDTYEWMPGGCFLIHTVDVTMGDQKVDVIEIIGYDPAAGNYPMYSFNSIGETALMHAEFSGGTWIFRGETERFTGGASEDGNTISGAWERLNGDNWEHWMDVKLTRAL